MFTATPPSVNRRRPGGQAAGGGGGSGGGGGGSRRPAGDRELPYVATKNSYSYGSQFSNMPKPPQLAETKVPLSVALKQQQEASNARMRAELEKDKVLRERTSTAEPEDHRKSDPNKAGSRLQNESNLMEENFAQQRTWSLRSRSVASEEPTTGISSSMPPPPRRRSPRIQTETSERSFSLIDSTLGMSRSYASEDDVGIVIGRKFTENLANHPDDVDDGSSTDEDDPTYHYGVGESLRGGLGAIPPKEPDPVPVPVAPLADGEDEAVLVEPEPWTFDWVFWIWNSYFSELVQLIIIGFMIVSVGSYIYINGINFLVGMDIRDIRASPFNFKPPQTPPQDFDDIRTRMQSVEKEIGNWGNYYSKFESGTDAIKKEVKVLRESLEKAKENVKTPKDELQKYEKELERLNALQQQITTNQDVVAEELTAIRELVEDMLPAKIVADQLEDGSYRISDKLESILEKIIRKKASNIIVDPGTGGHLAAFRPDWENFLEENELKMKNLIDQHTGVSHNPEKQGGVLLSHGTIKNLIDQKVDEFKKYKTEILLPEVRSESTKATQKYLKSQPAQIQMGAPAPETPEHADYASHLVGGTIQPYLTSPSYDYASPVDKLFYVIFGRGLRLHPQPAVAITPSKQAGQCWPFAGDSGSIGIRLARPIYITHISVEHIPVALAIDISSAPRDIEFWVKIEDDEERDRVENVASAAAGQAMWGPGRLWDRESPDSPEGPSGAVFDKFVKLASFKYDIARGSPKIQVFQVAADLEALNITARNVVFKIKNNWGHPTFTCVYQVRVHGSLVNPPKVYQETSIGAGDE